MMTKTSWKIGQSGNLNGRPKKGTSWREILREIADMREPKTGKKWKTLIAKALIEKAASGDTNAMKTLFYQMEGYPRQQAEITTTGRPIPILSNLRSHIDDD